MPSETKRTPTMEKMLDRWEKEYRLERAKEIQGLYNEIVEAIGKRNLHMPEILMALKLVEHGYLAERLKQIDMGKPPEEVMKA